MCGDWKSSSGQRCLSWLSASGRSDTAGTPRERILAAHDVQCVWLRAGGACCPGCSKRVTEALYDYMPIMKLYAVNLWIVGVSAVGVTQDGTHSIPSRRSMQASATCGPCQNGGECLEELSDTRVCTCLRGYTGIHCEVDYVQCEDVIRSTQNLTDTVALRAYLRNSPVTGVSQRAEMRDSSVYTVTCKAFIGIVRYAPAFAL